MISERHFRLQKNGEPTKYCFCRHPELIENYDKAITDETQIWDCHHKREEFYSRKELNERNEYFDRPPEELIFLTPADHISLHNKGKLINRKDQSKKVLCVETGEIFESMKDAERKTKILHNYISLVCNGKRKTSGGYHWRFV